MIEQEERTEVAPAREPSPHRRGGVGPAVLAAAVLIAALAGGGLAAAITLAVERGNGRTNPQSVDLRNNVTISATDAVTAVAAKALPAVVDVVTGTGVDGSPAGGSGFLVTSDGFVVTSVPVVAGSTKLVVLVAGDPKPHAAHLIDYDCQAGYAVLKADGISGAPTLSFGDSGSLKPGETLVALGRGSGAGEVAATIASSLARVSYFPDPADPNRQVAVSDSMLAGSRLLEGGGGAPLLNVGGQVVGITLPSPIGSPTAATAAAMVQAGVQQVVGGSALAIGGLGAAWLDVSPAQAALAGGSTGAQLTTVDAGGAAAAAGLQTGDVITQVDDVTIDDSHPLSLVLRSRFQPGQRVTLSYLRSGHTTLADLTLASQHPSCA